jgi:hypothetical protein
MTATHVSCAWLKSEWTLLPLSGHRARGGGQGVDMQRARFALRRVHVSRPAQRHAPHTASWACCPPQTNRLTCLEACTLTMPPAPHPPPAEKSGWPLVFEACTLTIAAEIGDRSQIATIVRRPHTRGRNPPLARLAPAADAAVVPCVLRAGHWVHKSRVTGVWRLALARRCTPNSAVSMRILVICLTPPLHPPTTNPATPAPACPALAPQALAAAQNPYFVALGAIVGHCVATGMAVLGARGKGVTRGGGGGGMTSRDGSQGSGGSGAQDGVKKGRVGIAIQGYADNAIWCAHYGVTRV